MTAEEYRVLYDKIIDLANWYPSMDVHPGFFPYELEYDGFLQSNRAQCGAGQIGMVIHPNGKYGYCGMTTHDKLKFSSNSW